MKIAFKADVKFVVQPSGCTPSAMLAAQKSSSARRLPAFRRLKPELHTADTQNSQISFCSFSNLLRGSLRMNVAMKRNNLIDRSRP